MDKKLFAALFTLVALYFTACTPKATRSFNKGKVRFESAEYQPAIENFQQCLAQLDKSKKHGPSKPEVNYYIAESYRRSNRIQEAEPYYKAAIAGNTTEEDAYFWYGFSLKSIGNYEGAATAFNNYLKIGQNFDYVNRAKNELGNLKVLNKIIAKKAYYKIENLTELNTSDAEYSPVYANQRLYFTSSRGSQIMHLATGTGFTDIYEYIFDGVEKYSGQAKRLNDKINTENAHEATPTFSRDGNIMIFSRGNSGKRKGEQNTDLFISIKENGDWAEPQKLSVSDTIAWDSSPFLAPDGRTLYFASDREGGNGGSDIYKATRDANGTWGNVVNMGTPVNTRGNDMFPFIGPDGAFYFSSDGHPSLGGLDLFVVKKDSLKKNYIENLGRPMNTSYDDFSIFYQDTINGYFASNRPDGRGDDDLYHFIDESRIRIAHYYIDGSIFQTDTATYPAETILANATIKIIDVKGDTIAIVRSDSLGRFKYEVQPETNYILVGSKPGYLTRQVEFSTVGKKIPPDKLKPGENDVNLGVKIVLPKKEEKAVIVIDNIYYDFNKWNIRPDAEIELYKIVEFMRNNPDISIELSAHTDERGKADYNRKLSQKRAQSAVDYIISKGITKARIIAKGYGEDKPLIKNAQTEEEHQKNRRTEITITNITNPNIEIRKKDESDEGLQLKKQGE